MKRKRLLLVILLLLIIVLLPTGIAFSRYVAEVIENYILEAQHFYFSSDKLKQGGNTYRVNNWSGVGNFTIQFSLNNRKNSLLVSDSDITYTVSASCGDGAVCSLDVNSGTIFTSESADNITLTVTPQRPFDDEESLTINVSASSTSPYTKTLSATFIITVGKRGISYEIVDKKNQPYFDFIITNAITSYTCRTAVGSYAVGDEISSDDYLALDDDIKSNFMSAYVTLSFDPNVVILDTTTDYINTGVLGFSSIGGINYISSISFAVDATSSTSIRFYKKDVSQNYTFDGSGTSIVTFSSV